MIHFNIAINFFSATLLNKKFFWNFTIYKINLLNLFSLITYDTKSKFIPEQKYDSISFALLRKWDFLEDCFTRTIQFKWFISLSYFFYRNVVNLFIKTMNTPMRERNNVKRHTTVSWVRNLIFFYDYLRYWVCLVIFCN